MDAVLCLARSGAITGCLEKRKEQLQKYKNFKLVHGTASIQLKLPAAWHDQLNRRDQIGPGDGRGENLENWKSLVVWGLKRGQKGV